MKEATFSQARHLLDLVEDIVVPATTKFIAREKFVVNTKHSARVKISFIGNNFAEWFLNGDGKVEEPRSETKLHYHKLLEYSVDGPIIQELGGEEKAETALSETFFLMERQKHGDAGVLLNNGYSNIFYVRDQADVLRAVDVFWGGGGWDVDALSVLDQYGWLGGSRVFSRNSVLMS